MMKTGSLIGHSCGHRTRTKFILFPSGRRDKRWRRNRAILLFLLIKVGYSFSPLRDRSLRFARRKFHRDMRVGSNVDLAGGLPKSAEQHRETDPGVQGGASGQSFRTAGDFLSVQEQTVQNQPGESMPST